MFWNSRPDYAKQNFFENKKYLLNPDKRKNLFRKIRFALRSMLFWIFGLVLLNYWNIWTEKSMDQTQVDYRIVSSK